jgi:hypothetical protein
MAWGWEGGVEVLLYCDLTSGLDTDQWSTPVISRFANGKGPYALNRRLVSPTAALDGYGE